MMRAAAANPAAANPAAALLSWASFLPIFFVGSDLTGSFVPWIIVELNAFEASSNLACSLPARL